MPQVIVRVSDGQDNLIGRLVQADPDMSDSIASIKVAEVRNGKGEAIDGTVTNWEDPEGEKQLQIFVPERNVFSADIDKMRGTVKFRDHSDHDDLSVVFDVELENTNRRPTEEQPEDKGDEPAAEQEEGQASSEEPGKE